MTTLTLIPFIGGNVKPLTPYEKYEDLNEQSLHHSLRKSSMENDFGNLKNIKELEIDKDFQQIRKTINDKEHIPEKEYNETCLNMAQKMGIRTNDVDLKQKIEQNLEKVLEKSKEFKNQEWKVDTSNLKGNYIVGYERKDGDKEDTVRTISQKGFDTFKLKPNK